MKYLVTGGAGFIGSNFIYYMLEEHAEDAIVCLDALTYAGNLATLDKAMQNSHFRFVKGDITDRVRVDTLFMEEKFDAVINFAAETHVDRSVIDPEVFLRTNLIGTQVLMDACRKQDIRFHQVSTDEVYGDLPLDRKDLLFTEKTPINASSPYSAAKAGADLMVQAYCRTFGLRATISRCSNNYGAYQFPEKLIPLMISRALAEQSMPVYGTGENVRDWLHVYDHCTAIYKIVQSGRIGEVYNIGGNNERTNREVIITILRELDKPESLISYVTDRPGHDRRYAIDSAKIQRELGWKPAYDFDTGMKETIRWYLDNKPWWENILRGEYQDYYEKMYANR